MEGDTSPFCSSCKEYLTVKHIMVDCRVFQKSKYFLNISPLLADSLSPDPQATEHQQAFLKRTKLYKSI